MTLYFTISKVASKPSKHLSVSQQARFQSPTQ